jgi:hypothetical protein
MRLQLIVEVYAEGTSKHQQIATSATAYAGFNAAIERSRTAVSVVRAPVNLVHNAPLGCRRKGRHREIGVASEIAQQGDLTIQPTAPAIRARVVQSPIPMNETENSSSVLLAKQPVVVSQSAAVIGDLLNESVALLVVMMKMYFHVGDPESDNFCYVVE